MGSSLALAVSLSMTGIVFLLMGDTTGRVAAEQGALLRGLAWTWSLTALGVAAFYGELRLRRWRYWPQALLLLLLIAAGLRYWPR